MLNEYAIYCRAAGMRPATIRLRMYWLRRASKTIDLATATRGDLLAWLSFGDWMPETRKSARSALRSFYAWAASEDVLAFNPAAKLPTVRVPLGVPRPAPTCVLRAALLTASDRDALLISLAAFAGLRRSEIAALQWRNIGQGIRVEGKGGRVRTVPLLPQLGQLLRAEAYRREAGGSGSGYRYGFAPASLYVFPGRDGGHISPFTVGDVLSHALGGGWTGHTLRHRFATLAYSVDRDLLAVQALLGHSKAETTAIYVEVPADSLRAAVAGAAA